MSALVDLAALWDSIPKEDASTLGFASPLQRLAETIGPKGIDNLESVLDLKPEEVVALDYPSLTLRPSQVFPLDDPKLEVMLLLAGRGFGKSRALSTAALEEARKDPHGITLLVGPTFATIRDVLLNGPAGILTISPEWFYPKHNVTQKLLTWPNGHKTYYIPAQDARALRGKQASLILADECVAWPDNSAIQVYEQFFDVARHPTPRMEKLNIQPRIILATTPEQNDFFAWLIEREHKRLRVREGHSLENRAFIPSSRVKLIEEYRGSSYGNREHAGKLSFANLGRPMFSGIPWDQFTIESADSEECPAHFDRICVSLDPASSESKKNNKRRDDTALATVGYKRNEETEVMEAYVLATRTFGPADPAGDWGTYIRDQEQGWTSRCDSFSVIIESNHAYKQTKAVVRQHYEGRIQKVKVEGTKVDRANTWIGLAEVGIVHLVGRHDKLKEQMARFPNAKGAAVDDLIDALSLNLGKVLVPSAGGRFAHTGDDNDE